MFHRTFFSVYLQNNDPLVGAGKFDYAFQVGDQRIYMLVHHESLEVESTNVEKRVLAELKQKAATQLNKRFQQLNVKHELPIAGQIIRDQHSEIVLSKVHYIGLSSIVFTHQGEMYQIEHEYGSRFFQEECVLDLDDGNHVLQLLSLNSFYKIIKLLQTPSDMLSFLDHHLQLLVNFNDFNGEFELAQQYLGSAAFFERAIAVQQKLVQIGLLSKVETRLTNMTNPEYVASAEFKQQQAELISKLQSYASTFQKLLNGTTKRRHEANDTIPIDQVKLLVAESMYTRLSIIEEMMAYETHSQQECLTGYMSHQHSYNDFGHHYVIIVYGLGEHAQYTREYVEQNYVSLLTDINAQLQDPAMKEYFILGFDMSDHDGQGNVKVKMDVFHHSGHQMTEPERRLYQQVTGE